MFKDPAEIRRFGTQIDPQTGRSQAKNARTDSDRFRTGFGVFPPRSKTFKLRDSSAEAWARLFEWVWGGLGPFGTGLGPLEHLLKGVGAPLVQFGEVIGPTICTNTKVFHTWVY